MVDTEKIPAEFEGPFFKKKKRWNNIRTGCMNRLRSWAHSTGGRERRIDSVLVSGVVEEVIFKVLFDKFSFDNMLQHKEGFKPNTTDPPSILSSVR